MASQQIIEFEHARAHLAWIDLLIRREILRLRILNGSRPDEEYRGLYVSEADLDDLLNETLPGSTVPTSPEASNAALASFDSLIHLAQEHIDGIEVRARQVGQKLPINRIAELFRLSELERMVIAICLAAEMDLKYERLFAYLQDDVTKKRPTVDLVMRLFCRSNGARLAARRAFEPDSPLLRWELVMLHEDPGARRSVLPARYLKLDERIAGYLLGSDVPDAHLTPIQIKENATSNAPLPDRLADQLANWARNLPEIWETVPPLILLHGRYGTGKRAAAAAFAKALRRPLLLLSAAELLARDLDLDHGVVMAERECRLTDAVLGWADADCMLHASAGQEKQVAAFAKALRRQDTPTILLAETNWEPAGTLGTRPFLRVKMPDLTYAERLATWKSAFDRHKLELSDADLKALAARFRLTAGQIHDACTRAQTLAWARDPVNACLLPIDIDAACRGQVQLRLDALAQKIEPHYNWDDIVLPRPQLTTLRLMCMTVRHRSIVYGEWGFDRKFSMGKGLTALFAGPSGTGKTMAADILANSLGLDLYKIDLSAVVSKYIGETEKNLEHIFSEAQDSNTILFFDEADALFGKRSEVKDAHDRYANIETAYLLQRMEAFDGVVILATNLRKNMDEAFARRLTFSVDFPFPEETERLQIWRHTFPAETPVAADIDLTFLARKLKITGGNIRNAILTAAFLAVEEQQPVGMHHLILGAGHEYQKMGKLVVEDDFEQYFNLVKNQAR